MTLVARPARSTGNIMVETQARKCVAVLARDGCALRRVRERGLDVTDEEIELAAWRYLNRGCRLYYPSRRSF
jgi:hypothetical protein